MDAHANFAVSSVATAPSPATSGTSLVVATGEGARFPAVPFNATVCPAGVLPTPANAEIVRVTGRTSDTLTIVRTQESTSARTIVVGDLIFAAVTAKTLTDIEAAIPSAGLSIIYDSILGGAAASFDVTGISASYTILQINITGRGDASQSQTDLYLRLNNDSGGNYDSDVAYLANTTWSPISLSGDTRGIYFGAIPCATATAGEASTSTADIHNYADTTYQKTIISRCAVRNSTAAASFAIFHIGGWWRNTAAINRITVTPFTGNFAAGSRCTITAI